MKKIILGLFLFSLLVSPVAFAKDEENSSRIVNTACVSTAVGLREDALLGAWSKFDDAVTAVLIARKSALISAWTLTDAKARKKAVKDAWITARKDRRAAAKTYREERRAAWKTFKTAAKACGGTAASEASSESDSTENVEI